MENIRRNRGFINGIVYWMWNDCWPASSGWAFVDYYCLPKASFYSFKRCAKQILASIDKTDKYEIYLCNDGLSDKQVKLSLHFVQSGTATPITAADVTVSPAKSEIVFSVPLTDVPENAILICDVTSDETLIDRAFYKSGTLPIVPTDAVKVVSRTENAITVMADKYVHAVELDGEFVFDDNCFSLLPDEKRTITFRPSSEAQSNEINISGYTVESCRTE